MYAKCDTCGNEGELFVYALPGIPMSVANCQVCLDVCAYPYYILVGNTAMIGGVKEAADWWKEAILISLARHGKTLKQFNEDVENDIKAMQEGEGM